MIRHIVVFTFALSIFILGQGNSVNASIISSYDIEGTRLSGTAGWEHTYTGSIVSSGGAYDYSGGGGTLNDGLFGTDEYDTHLLEAHYSPSLTLHLDGSYDISAIYLWSFPTGNAIPGDITGVHINGTSYTTLDGSQMEESVNLGSALTNVSMLTFTNFITTSGMFAISEITFDATLASTVPEPTTVALLGLGIVGLAGAEARRRRKKKEVDNS